MALGEIGPKDNLEMFISVCLLFGGLLINNLILSNIAVLLSKIQQKSILF